MAQTTRMAAALAMTVLIASLATAASAANPVLVFNTQAQGRVREGGVQNQLSSKIYALTHLAQLVAIDETASESLQAAQAAFAGHTVLNLLFPWAFSKHDAALKNFTTGLSAKDLEAARQAGRTAGIAVVTDSLGDGFSDWANWFSPSPANGPVGKYQFTPNQTYALYPQLARTKTVILPANQTFGLKPHTLPSANYTTDLAEVFKIGRKNATGRSQKDTDSAYFWADGNTTSTVVGHWNQIAQVVVSPNISTAAAALLFSQINVAVWDASIAGWGLKYSALFWRPITAIRQGDNTSANAAYVDATWTPELPTPPHPEYPSGHSISAGAAAGALANYFGTDKVAFTIGTEFPGLAPRSYKSFQEAVEDVNYSRIVGGVHFRKAVEDGALLGRQVADYIADNLPDADALANKA